MPITKQSTGAATAAVPVRPGETWGQYITRLRTSQENVPAQMAGMIAATALMRKDPNALANGRMVEVLAARLSRQRSFRSMVRDPEARRMTAAGKGAELIVRLGEHKKRLELERQRYAREPSKVKEDAVFFKDALKAVQDKAAAGTPAQKERESLRLAEMVKRLDHARSLAEQGIPLDGKTARELAQAVQSYNDGGSRTPGGKHEASASREALCVLKHVMPEDSFGEYCDSINQAHGAENPNHHRHVNPADLSEALVNGSARTARDLMLASQRAMSRGMTQDGCAMATAVMTLSGGNPNAIIRREALEAEVGRLQQPGSAFLKAMSDDASREKYAQLAAQGKVTAMSKTIIKDAKEHSIRTAQWHINQSVKSLGKDGGASVDKLAEILAARQMAAQSGPGQRITNGEFKAKAQQIKSSPEFADFANRYQKDPMLREKVNTGLFKGDAGKTLEQEVQSVKPAPEAAKEAQQQKEKEPPVLVRPAPIK